MSDLMQWVAGREALERDVAELRARFADVRSLLGQAPIEDRRVVYWRRAANGHLQVARDISLRRPSPALTRQIDELQDAVDGIEVLPAPSTPPAKDATKKRTSAKKPAAKKRPGATKAHTKKPKRPSGGYVPVFTDEPQTCKVCGAQVPPFRRHADILDSHRDSQQRWCQGGVLPPEVTNAMSRIAALKRGEVPRKKREDTRPVKVVSGGLPSLGRGR